MAWVCMPGSLLRAGAAPRPAAPYAPPGCGRLAPVHTASLVGRARERDAIAAAVQALPSSRGTVLAIEGEPGIGKSRLLAHLPAAADRCSVVAARASEFEADLPYALWIDALPVELTPGDRPRPPPALR